MSTRLRSLAFRLFVRLCAADILDSVYLGILARAPDSAGRDAYAEKLREASDLTNVLSEIIRSDEFREKSIAALAPELVRAAFQGVLERVPEPRALTFYAQSLAAKRDLGALLSEIIHSQEFREKSLVALAPQLVRAAFLGTFEREPEADELAFYAQSLVARKDLGGLLTEIIHSQEFRERALVALAPQLVRATYQGLLEREPEPEALASYAQSLAAKKDVSALISEILRSEEFREKSLAALAPQLVQATYRGLLGREPEAQVLASLAENVAERKDLAALLGDTIHSDEFRERSLAALAPQLVRAAYQGLLEREPDPEALASYAQSLAAKRDVSALLNEILRSQEFREKSLAALAPELVQATYQGLLERAPEPKALTSYSQSLAARRNLGALLSEIIHSQEFHEKALAALAPELVRAAFQGVLGREPEPKALASYAESLAAKSNLEGLLTELVHSNEFRGKSLAALAPELVRAAFQGVLGREPEPKALASYAESLAAKSNLGELLTEMVHSEEFRGKSLTAPAAELVRAAFQGVLEREPEPKALASYAQSLAAKKDLGALLRELIGSKEFAAKQWARARHRWPHPRASYDSPAVIFLHVQKTAGTSMQNMLRAVYDPREVFSEHTDSLHLRSPAELAQYRVFAGHFNYDSVDYIRRRKVSVFTFVREPRKRLLSLYHFWRAHEPGHPSYHRDMAAANDMELHDFFAEADNSGKPTLWNHMTWVIMGDRQWRAWRAELAAARNATSTGALLSTRICPAVRERLGGFLFVGIQEDFQRSASVLFKILNRPTPDVAKDHSLEDLMRVERSFKKEMPMQRVTPEVTAALDRLVQIDDIIYGEAKALYERFLKQYPERARTGGNFSKVHATNRRKRRARRPAMARE